MQGSILQPSPPEVPVPRHFEDSQSDRAVALHTCSNVGMVQVVAAIIERDGRILVGQRMPGQSHPLKWEFPGGKVEPGETPEQALARELEEELGVSGAAGEIITRYQFAYPGKDPIELLFFRI